MPFFGDAEQEWPRALRAVLYVLGMAWIFIGVAIVADLFMGAIEEVTTKISIKTDKATGKRRVVRFWNPTVANLSLMALGSSAPEIMLNVKEIVLGSGEGPFYAGQLGPSTIVGSAAFNLLVIIAVCVMSITDGPKAIIETKVYMITATMSVLVYVWLLVILVVMTPDIITLAEAIVTFLAFFVLLIVTYVADKDCFRGKAKRVAPSAAASVELEGEKKPTPRQGSFSAAADEARLMMQAVQNYATGATHARNALSWLTGKRAKPTVPMGPGGRRASVARKKTISQMRLDAAETNAVLHFKEEAIDVLENCGKVQLIVLRGGPESARSTEVSVEYKSYDITAVGGKDYVHVAGTLTFAPDQLEARIDIEIIDDDRWEQSEHFRVQLSACSEGAQLDDDGRGEQAMVTILNDDELKEEMSKMRQKLGNRDKYEAVRDAWQEQFVDAIKPSVEEGETAGTGAWVAHSISAFWKVLFATVPPPMLGGGWPAFYVSLGYIGAMTIFVSDLASLFGCVIGCPAGITAITFVALGTSMPDLFASKMAAQADDSADNSVGNVTGSNCVNVLLGLGLPWTIGALYWSMASDEAQAEWAVRYAGNKHVQKHIAEGGSAAFVVEAGDLGLSVIVFCCCSLVCLGILYVRRVYVGGELGGPYALRVATAITLVSLWVIYVLVSSLKILRAFEFSL